ncbi:MAG: fumarylacetoacetate hydrolase family protein [Caldilineaceae bacterium]
MRLRVNGEQRQESSVSDLIFNVIQYLSLGATLKAGTIICTGTTSGVGTRLHAAQLPQGGRRRRPKLTASAACARIVGA